MSTIGLSSISSAVLLLALGVAACDTDPISTSVTPSALRSAVTGDAAAALGADGQLRLAPPKSLDGQRLITPMQARRLTMAFVRSFGQSYLPTWEADRGGTIQLSKLTPGPRVYFAQTPYVALTEPDIHAAYKLHVGPYFIVILQQDDQPVVIMAVSALATAYSINQQGLLVMPKETGMDFLHEGIPPGRNARFRPISPEEAVLMAHEATGAKVKSVPELVTVGGASPTIARWRVELDRDVSITSAGAGDANRMASTVFVGSVEDARFAVPSPLQPIRGMRMLRASVPEDLHQAQDIELRLHAGRAADYQTVHFSKEN
jgi:hypothetical protein